MSKNKILLLVVIIAGGLLIGQLAVAGEAKVIHFKPSVPIPGVPLSAEGTMDITPTALGEYINAIYKYGAGFAALLAMFMLVIAGWQWMMAGGQPDRVNRAKDIIIGVFVGLALLFGGNLLMSQISSRLVNFNPLVIDPIKPQGLESQVCRQLDAILKRPPYNVVHDCGERINTHSIPKPPGPDDPPLSELDQFLLDNALVLESVSCYGGICEDNKECIFTYLQGACPSAGELGTSVDCSCAAPPDCTAEPSCGVYKTQYSCRDNTCYNPNTWAVGCQITPILKICEDLAGTVCIFEGQCGRDEYDINHDGTSEYCCESSDPTGLLFHTCQLKSDPDTSCQ